MLAEVQPVVASLKPEERVSIYYAQGLDGLKTECDSSMHAQLIQLAGAINVRHCASHDRYGMEAISLEQVMVADPDVILAKEHAFADRVGSDPQWAHVRADYAGGYWFDCLHVRVFKRTYHG